MEEIDTDLSHYTINDIFNLLDITITNATDYDLIKKEIIIKTNEYINSFTILNNSKMAFFFKTVQTYFTENRDANLSVVQDLNKNSPSLGGTTNQMHQLNGVNFDTYNWAGNPINRKTITKLLNVDSINRDPIYPSSTDFIINLQNPINNVIEIKLCDLELPTTYYPISTALGNNYMWIKINNSNSSSEYYYLFIPDGNYYYDDLITYILSVDALGNNALSTRLNIDFDLNYQNAGGVGTGTGKIKFGIYPDTLSTANKTVELNFTGNAIPLQRSTIQVTDPQTLLLYSQVNNVNLQFTLGWLLGFRKSLYTGSKYYISESVLDIIGPKYLFLIIRDGTNGLNTNVNFISAGGSGLDGDIIARISLKGPAFNIQAQNDFSLYTEPRYYYGPKKIEKIVVNLVDEHSRTLDLNQHNFSFTLRLTTVYASN